MKASKKKTSLRQYMLLAVIIILLPLTITFTFFIYKALEEVNSQIAQANLETLQVFCNNISQQIRNAESSIITYALANDDFKIIGQGLSEEPQDIGEKILEGFDAILEANTDVSAFILFQPNSDFYVSSFNADRQYSEEEEAAIQNMLTDYFNQRDRMNLGWFVIENRFSSFLVRIVEANKVAAICLIDLPAISDKSRNNRSIKPPVIITDKDNILGGSEWLENENLKLEDVNNPYFFIGKNNKYMIVHSSVMGLEFLYPIIYEEEMNYIGWLRTGPFMFVLTVMISIIVVWLYLKQYIFLPMNGMISTMKMIQSGDIDARLDHYRNQEFEEMSDSFNRMMNEIKNLKIDNYEIRIREEHTHLEALRSQIRPHFFLNCLKNIYGLAQVDDTENIQKSIFLLSKHLRYTFAQEEDMVDLDKELQMCQNYVSLQSVGLSNQSKCLLDVEPSLLKCKILPISLLTIVENSIKHGVRQQSGLIITIKARKLLVEDMEMAHIKVKDNGPGFNEESLRILNQKTEVYELKGHIGLLNVISRFTIIYGESFAISFCNNDGAVVDLFIPLGELIHNEGNHC